MSTQVRSKFLGVAVIAAFFVALIWGVNTGVICATQNENQTCPTTQGGAE